MTGWEKEEEVTKGLNIHLLDDIAFHSRCVKTLKFTFVPESSVYLNRRL